MEQYENYVKKGEIVILPWESFDGLTVGEVLEIIHQKGFTFTCYTFWKDDKAIPARHHLYVHFFLSFTSDFIDKIVENNLSTTYPKANDKVKKICRCFFERYQDRDYQETVDRVKKL